MAPVDRRDFEDYYERTKLIKPTKEMQEYTAWCERIDADSESQLTALDKLWMQSQVKPINMTDRNIHSPSHYTSGGIEAIDYIKAKLGTDGCIAYCLGNVIKYVSRAGKKDVQKELEDLKKAQWYLNKAVQLNTSDDDYYVA